MGFRDQRSTADNIAAIKRKTKQPQQQTVNSAQLDALVTQFEEFYGELEQETAQIHETEEDRLVAVERYVQRIEASLVTEQQRRVAMYATLQDNLQKQADALKHRTAAQFAALQPEIPKRLSAWHDRLAADEQALEEEKIRTRELIERESARLNKVLDDFQANLELEKMERLEREAQTLKKVIDDNFAMVTAIDEERSRREAVLGQLREENDTIDRLRDRPEAVFKAEMMKRMVKATTNIKLETSRRVSGERQFVESLEGYATGLQSGLRLVNQKPMRS